MGLKGRTEGHKPGGLVGRAVPMCRGRRRAVRVCPVWRHVIEDSGREGRGKGSRVVMSCLGEMRCDAG